MSNAYESWKRRSAAGLLLAGCLVAAPAFSQEIIKWVDEDGVTHFGHAATAARQAMREHMRGETTQPGTKPETMVAGAASVEPREPAVAAEVLAAATTSRASTGGID